MFLASEHRFGGRFRCGNVSGVSCHVRCGADYRVPETSSALLWDLPPKQLPEGRRFGGRQGIFGWQENLSIFLWIRGIIGPWSEVAGKRNPFWISKITMSGQHNGNGS